MGKKAEKIEFYEIKKDPNEIWLVEKDNNSTYNTTDIVAIVYNGEVPSVMVMKYIISEIRDYLRSFFKRNKKMKITYIGGSLLFDNVSNIFIYESKFLNNLIIIKQIDKTFFEAISYYRKIYLKYESLRKQNDFSLLPIKDKRFQYIDILNMWNHRATHKVSNQITPDLKKLEQWGSTIVQVAGLILRYIKDREYKFESPFGILKISDLTKYLFVEKFIIGWLVNPVMMVELFKNVCSLLSNGYKEFCKKGELSWDQFSKVTN